MNLPVSRLSMDVSGRIDVTNPESVCTEVLAIFTARYPSCDFSIVPRLFQDFAALYRGEFPGFLACDTSYHDMQHVLDVSLAMARLLDGYDRSHPEAERLGAELALVGLVVALFHDSGYIRRDCETEHFHGAEFTRIHVSRSARFMAEYLPQIGLAAMVELSGQLVHFTGYEYAPDQIVVAEEKQRVVGALVGTADVIAQMADPAYLEKCRDRLYPEFEVGGITRQRLPDGTEQVVYASAEDLLIKTPAFIKHTITDRLDGYFGGLYRNVAAHFGGRNLYMEALENNCRHLETIIAGNDRNWFRASLMRPR